MTKPNIARVWDYWLGGKDNFTADRELAQKLLEVHPVSAQMARDNRDFLGRAVGYVAAAGVRQFIDVGAGLPTALNTHDIAQGIDVDARVAYVDNDEMVISHARSLLATSPRVVAVPGDMLSPERILADEPADRPHRLGQADLRDLVRCPALHRCRNRPPRRRLFGKALVSGGYLIISCGWGNRSEENFKSSYWAARVYIHSPEQIESF